MANARATGQGRIGPGDWIRHTVEVYGPGKIEVLVGRGTL